MRIDGTAGRLVKHGQHSRHTHMICMKGVRDRRIRFAAVGYFFGFVSLRVPLLFVSPSYTCDSQIWYIESLLVHVA